jgi:hypothetical protein
MLRRAGLTALRQQGGGASLVESLQAVAHEAQG